MAAPGHTAVTGTLRVTGSAIRVSTWHHAAVLPGMGHASSATGSLSQTRRRSPDSPRSPSLVTIMTRMVTGEQLQVVGGRRPLMSPCPSRSDTLADSEGKKKSLATFKFKLELQSQATQ